MKVGNTQKRVPQKCHKCANRHKHGEGCPAVTQHKKHGEKNEIFLVVVSRLLVVVDISTHNNTHDIPSNPAKKKKKKKHVLLPCIVAIGWYHQHPC